MWCLICDRWNGREKGYPAQKYPSEERSNKHTENGLYSRWPRKRRNARSIVSPEWSRYEPIHHRNQKNIARRKYEHIRQEDDIKYRPYAHQDGRHTKDRQKSSNYQCWGQNQYPANKPQSRKNTQVLFEKEIHREKIEIRNILTIKISPTMSIFSHKKIPKPIWGAGIVCIFLRESNLFSNNINPLLSKAAYTLP